MNKEDFIVKYKLDAQALEELNKIIGDAERDKGEEVMEEGREIKKHPTKVDKNIEIGDFVSFVYRDSSATLSLIVSAKRNTFTYITDWLTVRTETVYEGRNEEYSDVILVAKKGTPEWKTQLEAMYHFADPDFKKMAGLYVLLHDMGIDEDIISKFKERIGKQNILQELKDKLSKCQNEMNSYRNAISSINSLVSNAKEGLKKEILRELEERSKCEKPIK